MSYATKIDEMIGKHVAEYQAELSLAKKLKHYLANPAMPYGYPIAVYRPMHVCRTPQVQHFVAHSGGTLSNKVPRVLSMEIIGDYPLGIYNLDFGKMNSAPHSDPAYN